MSAVDESVGVDERSVEKPLEKNSSWHPFPHPSFLVPTPTAPLFSFQCLVRSPHKLAVCLARVAAETRARRPTRDTLPTQRVLRLRPPRARAETRSPQGPASAL